VSDGAGFGGPGWPAPAGEPAPRPPAGVQGTSKNDATDVKLGRSRGSRGSRAGLASGFSVFSGSPAGLFPSQCGLQADSSPDDAYRDNREHNIEVRMAALVGKRLTVTITDDGVPFNPLSVEAPDTDLSLEDREVGGLGIHLVRNLVDDVSYHRRIGKNVLTLMSHLQQKDSAA